MPSEIEESLLGEGIDKYSGQFCHVATYSRRVSALSGKQSGGKKGKDVKKRAKIWTVSDIAAEADRKDPTHFPHVPTPHEPIRVAGIDVGALEELCDALLVDAKQANGKALRADTHVLLGAVYSIDVKGAEYESHKERCDKFVADSLAWHEKTYGKVVSAVAHTDEGFFHAHVYSISADARGLIPGWRAKREAIKLAVEDGKTKIEATKIGNVAYKEAMVKVQDSYYFDVGIANGLARYGNRRMRYQPGTGESAAQKRQREELALREQAYQEQRQRDRRKLDEAIARQRRLNEEADQKFVEAGEELLRMMEEAERLKKKKNRIETSRREFNQMVEHLLATPEYVREQQLQRQKEDLANARMKIQELEGIVSEKNSLIETLKAVITELKIKLKRFFSTSAAEPH